jgi:pimeloyl-[acyl-carrier protein] methyl ester esterase
MHNPLVFLPGLGFKPSIWKRIASLSNRDCLLLDFADPHVIPLDSTIIAWSWGGLSAIHFSYQFPQHCKRLILVASTPKFVVTDNWSGISYHASENFIQQMNNDISLLKKNFLSWVQYPDHQKLSRYFLHDHFTDDAFIKNAHTLFSADMREMYQQLTMPIHHIFGEEDVILPVSVASQLAAYATIEVIPQAGHAAFITHEKIFLDKLRGILDE